MPMFRRRPIVVEARRFNIISDAEQEALAAWCGGLLRGMELTAVNRVIQIPTFEGEMEVEFGDVIIKGVKGEFYPCKPEIFALTYEPAE